MHTEDSSDSGDREVASIALGDRDPLLSSVQFGFAGLTSSWEPPRVSSSRCSGIRLRRLTNPMPVLEREQPQGPMSPVAVPDSLDPNAPASGSIAFTPFQRDTEGNLSSFRLAATGVIFMVFRHALSKGNLRIEEEELERLVLLHKELNECPMIRE